MLRPLFYHCSQRYICAVIRYKKGKFHGLKRFDAWKGVEEDEEAEPFLNEQMSQVHNFTRYRETLFRDNELNT